MIEVGGRGQAMDEITRWRRKKGGNNMCNIFEGTLFKARQAIFFSFFSFFGIWISIVPGGKWGRSGRQRQWAQACGKAINWRDETRPNRWRHYCWQNLGSTGHALGGWWSDGDDLWFRMMVHATCKVLIDRRDWPILGSEGMIHIISFPAKRANYTKALSVSVVIKISSPAQCRKA